MSETLTALRHGVRIMVFALIAAVVVLTYKHDTMHMVHPDEGTASVPARCWTGNAPKDVFMPTHVWAQIPGGEVGIYGAPWVGKALNQTTGKSSTIGLTVMGFCR